ncbi:hypothetical protein BHE74_00035240 [Ensete ventricosum]|nr:hypothetical protein GW17_00022553 [Ensete ventricosum]RWW57945.1 hypothetical protein BHE74_00035240 [Ensete ventricosum]RZR91932.1 hypothetical protein BHM03_00020132 [Ensete ventricosum]
MVSSWSTPSNTPAPLSASCSQRHLRAVSRLYRKASPPLRRHHHEAPSPPIRNTTTRPLLASLPPLLHREALVTILTASTQLRGLIASMRLSLPYLLFSR